jgi:hypothetical protein
MVVLPLVATAISALFAWSLHAKYRSSQRLHLLAWAVSLVMFAIASATLFLADLYGWGPWLYRSFWLFGALLNVPWLALGSACLAWPKLSKPLFAVTIVASVYALVATVAADPVTSALALEDAIPRRKDAWPPGSNMHSLVRVYSIGGWLVVVALAAWTSRVRGGMKPSQTRIRANALIAIGVTIVGIGGFALSRFGGPGLFSVTLALGVAIMYVGFLMASRAPRFVVTDPGEQAT